MRHLILVKHALPQIEPAVPAHEWLLCDEGRRSCAVLAQHLAAYRPACIVSSREPKAAETAAVEREVAATPGNVIIVAHGTVIALFVARCCNIAPFPLWQQLGLPSYVVLALPSRALVAVCGDIDGAAAL